MTFSRAALILVLLVGPAWPAAAQDHSIDHVPSFAVTATCDEARKFSTGQERESDYQGCVADERRAKAQLEQAWSSFKAADKRECVEEGPDPSYVELQTCLQLDVDKKIGDAEVPQIGGPVAPGLTPNK